MRIAREPIVFTLIEFEFTGTVDCSRNLKSLSLSVTTILSDLSCNVVTLSMKVIIEYSTPFNENGHRISRLHNDLVYGLRSVQAGSPDLVTVAVIRLNHSR